MASIIKLKLGSMIELLPHNTSFALELKNSILSFDFDEDLIRVEICYMDYATHKGWIKFRKIPKELTLEIIKEGDDIVAYFNGNGRTIEVYANEGKVKQEDAKLVKLNQTFI